MKTVTLIPGDGIGPEIADSVVKLFKAASIPIVWELVEAGLDVYQKSGVLIPKELGPSLERNVVGLKGPTTTPIGSGHRSINVTMRQEFDLYANVRPIAELPGVPCLTKGIDLIIVRENSEDLYKGVEKQISPDEAHSIKIITRPASRRIAIYAFELAKKLGRKKVTAVHKANIMKLTDGLFLNTVKEVAASYPSSSLMM